MLKTTFILFFGFITILSMGNFYAQEVLFDFDSAPLYTSLPIDQTAGEITAHLSATAPGYSIQDAGVLGFTPPGFAGHIIYPNSINLADLLIRFDKEIISFSIMYSCQELGCDDAATMRVTAYMNGAFVGTDTRTATFPGTWPVDTLRCSFPQGFDSVVVHYDSPPPTCQDYGTIFMADNMRVSPLTIKVVPGGELPRIFTLEQNYPNPFNPSTIISYTITERENVSLKVFDLLGREVVVLFKGETEAGTHNINFNAGDIPGGVYFYRIQAGKFTVTKKMILLK